MDIDVEGILQLDARSFVGKSAALLGITDSGKTNTGAVLIEELLTDGLPMTICDIEGEYWGLKERFEILVAGRSEHADLLLNPENAGALARASVERGLSVILDLSEYTEDESYVCLIEYFTALWRVASQVRRPYQVVLEEAHEWCMTDDTEILTPYGWKRWHQVNPGDYVVGFDLSTGEYGNEIIQRLITREYEGEMIALQTRFLDCVVTPDHRVVLRRIQRASPVRYKVYDWTFCQAVKVPSCVQIPIGGAPEGEGITELSDQLLRIVGWVITDGYFCNGTSTSILSIEQATSTTKCGKNILSEMDAVFSAIPGVTSYDRTARTIVMKGKVVNSTPTRVWYLGKALSAQIGIYLEKEIHRIPRKILQNASKYQLSVLLQGLMEGDGTSVNGKWKTFYPGLNEGLADDMQELLTRLGVNAIKSWITHKDNGSHEWRVNIAGRQHHHIRRPQLIHYSGVVWDITASTGAFVARRNGTVFVTGNCPKVSERG